MYNYSSIVFFLVFCLSFSGCKHSSNPIEKEKEETKHGIIDFFSIEEIIPDVSTKADVKNKLGNPEDVNETNDRLYYHYPSQGIRVVILKINNIVDDITVYGSHWDYNCDGREVTYTKYPYATNNDIYLENPESTMDDIVGLYGQPVRKFTYGDSARTDLHPRAFVYTRDSSGLEFTMNYFFLSTDSSQYQNRTIIRISLW